MTFEIRHDGRTFTVHTEVGEGLTQVKFEENEPQEQQPLEPSEETTQ